MVFDYYHKLSKRDKAIYRASDRVEAVPLRHPGLIKPLVAQMQRALAKGDRKKTEQLAVEIVHLLTAEFKAPGIKVNVLSVRPSNNRGELHGLYEPVDGKKAACISVWMRTAKHKKVVAFRTFFRTLLHEVCHHLDYEVMKLADSFHTEGFFKRESSLFKQLYET